MKIVLTLSRICVIIAIIKTLAGYHDRSRNVSRKPTILGPNPRLSQAALSRQRFGGEHKDRARGEAMTILYNCKSADHPGAYIITKFDNDMNVESTYLVTNGECACPRGSHPTCRHRKMLRDFVKQKHVDDGWFLDFDTKLWHQLPALEIETSVEAREPAFTNAPVEEVAEEPVLPPSAPSPDTRSSASTGAPKLARRMVRQ
jgi:hypothetical protein